MTYRSSSFILGVCNFIALQEKQIPLGSELVFEEISLLFSSCLITLHYCLERNSRLCLINFNIFFLSSNNKWIILLINHRTHIKLWMMSSSSVLPSKSREEHYVMGSILVTFGTFVQLALHMLLREHFFRWFQRENKREWKELIEYLWD